MAEDSGGGGGLAKAAGVGLLGVLAAFGKVADDCGKAGAKMASHADDVAKFGAKGADGLADDMVKLGDDAVKFADDVPGPLRGAGHVPVSQADEAYKELVHTVVEEGAWTGLEMWLDEGEDDEDFGDEAGDAVRAAGRPVRVLWSFLPLAKDSVADYLGEHSLMDLMGHETFVKKGDLVLKPVFSGLPVNKTFGLPEALKVYVGYTAEDQPDHLRTWEAGPAPIAVLQQSCLSYQQACLVVACQEQDLSKNDDACAVATKGLTLEMGKTKSAKAALRHAVAWRAEKKRTDMVFHVALVDDGKPRLLRSALGETPSGGAGKSGDESSASPGAATKPDDAPAAP